MNVVKVMGGIGNQLFQYAFGKLQTKRGTYVLYDTTWYTKHRTLPERPFRLDKFNLKYKSGNFKPMNTTVKEVSYDPNLITLWNHNFHGYWQYLDYYKDIIPELREEFKVKEQYITSDYKRYLNKIKQGDSIAVHVRRGDYLNKGHVVLPLDYYQTALSNLRGNIFIFSDDIPWCKKYFQNAIFIEKVDDYLAFELMRMCTHQVISNSTFSWWAAILNDNPRKIVYAPEQWIIRKEDKDKYNRDKHYPKDWRMIDAHSIFDILVVVAEKDFNKLPYCLHSIKKNIKGYGKIFCITDKPVKEKVSDVEYVLENGVVDFNFSKIKNISRIGWYKQQFIKLFQTITHHNYLVVDADVIINKPLNIIDAGKPVFMLGKDQNHDPYYSLMNSMFGFGREYPHSFISEVMYFKRDIIDDLLSRYGWTKHGFFEVVVSEINKQSHPSGFSEYELYGNYVTKFFNDTYHYRNIKTSVNGKHKQWTAEEIIREIEINKECDIISMHSWI